jgi:selenocysteine lyase/cysteine desulfurase
MASGVAAATLPAVANARTPMLGREDFAVQGVFLNAAYTHPMSVRTGARIAAFVAERERHVDRSWTDDNARDAAVAQFAGLVGVRPQDIAIVPSTTTGENMLIDALGIGTGAGVVTDSLHYFGSLALYQQKAVAGMPLKVVRPRGFGIHLADIEQAIDATTRLIAVSLVSGLNGFTHDLTALCAMAHARGVLVYADIIQAAGAMPLDLTATGVDFAGCGGYKWLMGDFGAAFLFVRPDRLPLLQHKAVGWRQVDGHQTHWLPFDPPGTADDFTFLPGPAGLFEIGTPAHGALAALAGSIADLRQVGIARIAQRRRPLIDRLQREIAALGLTCLSPRDNPSAIVTFACRDAATRIKPVLRANGITAQVSSHRVRISPSTYTDDRDITRVIAAIAQAVRS